MTKNDQYLIQQDLQFHAKNPLNFGLLSDLDFLSDQQNPSCGDSVVVGGMIQDGKIKKLCFQGSGCVISIAMASKLTQALIGMDIDEIEKIDETLVESLLGLSLGPNRLQCGLLSIIALQKGIFIYQKSLKI